MLIYERREKEGQDMIITGVHLEYTDIKLRIIYYLI